MILAALPVPRSKPRGFSRQGVIAALTGVILISICCAWSLYAAAQVRAVIIDLVNDPSVRDALLKIQRSAALSQGVVVATLLGLVATGTGIVVTLRNRYEDQLEAEIHPFLHAGQMLSERMTSADSLHRLLAGMVETLPITEIRIFEFEPDDKEFVEHASSRPGPEGSVWEKALADLPMALQVIQEDRTVWFRNLDEVTPGERAIFERLAVSSAILIPLGPPGSRSGILLGITPSQAGIGLEALIKRLEQTSVLISAFLAKAHLYTEAQTRADDLVMLNEAGRLLVESPDIEASLFQIASLVQRQFQVSGTAIYLEGSGGQELAVQSAAGRYERRLQGVRIPLSKPDPVSEAFVRGECVVEPDVSNRSRAFEYIQQYLPDLGSCSAIPMLGSRGPVGVLAVYHDQRRRYPNRALQRLRSVARLAASAVERGNLGLALKATEARLQEILDGIPALVIGVDHDLKILSFNFTAETVTGWRRDQAIGKDFLGLLIRQERERQKLREVLDQALEEGGHSEGEVGIMTDLKEVPHRIRWSTEALRGPDGSLMGLVVMGVDYTDQLKLEAQLLQAQKMESVGTLAGGMAHDFNNLLGGVLGQVALAKPQLPPDHPVRAIIQKIEGAAQRGTDLTGTLLTFARRSVLQPRPVDITALIGETVDLLRGSLSDMVDVQMEIEQELPQVQGDGTQLQQVLLNLFMNARDAMPAGGSLKIKASADPHGGIRIIVADEGIGMTEEVKAHLFEPFFTTKDPGKGTGLGLAVVFGIVRSHGGTIEVESRPGHGTCFTIYLPPRAPRPSAGSRNNKRFMPPLATASALRDAVPFSGEEELLVIDDEEMLRDTTRELLARLGYNVHTVGDGGEALNLLDQKKLNPKLILLDVIMPGLAGIPLLWELRRRLPDTPIILISGFSREVAVQELLDGGAEELIQKPFRLDHLAAAIRRALSKRSEMSHPTDGPERKAGTTGPQESQGPKVT